MGAMFEDRADAGRRLATALSSYKDARPAVLALPRGGVALAAAIPEALDAPFGLILVRKIGAPGRPELALGAVVDGNTPCATRTSFRLSASPRRGALPTRTRGDRAATPPAPPAARVDVAGRVVIVVDEGIATGATMRAALRAIRMGEPKKLVRAVPVAAPDALDELRSDVDSLVCLISEQPFTAIGSFYVDFHQMTDAEVTSADSDGAGHQSRAHEPRSTR